MVKKIIPFALLLALVGCKEGELNDSIVKVQAETAKYCQFVPTAETVADILTSGNPTVKTVAGAAKFICMAVASIPTTQPNTLFGFGKLEDCLTKVGDVCINGTFVKPEEKVEEKPLTPWLQKNQECMAVKDRYSCVADAACEWILTDDWKELCRAKR